MIRDPRRPQQTRSFGNRLLARLTEFLNRLQERPTAAHLSNEPTVPTATPAAQLAEPIPAAPDTAVAIAADVIPHYIWKPSTRYPTIRDALAVTTALPNGDTVVGYPALIDPAVPLSLFQVERSADPFLQQDLARLIPPGAIAIVASAYYPTVRRKEIPHKRNVGHVGLAVGIEREIEQAIDGQPQTVKQTGVLTVHNPQSYMGGSFDSYSYGTHFIQQLIFPPEITEIERLAYEKNIITLTALANTYIPFTQRDFNGDDPLGIHNADKIREAGAKLVLAVYGDADAQQWLQDAENTAYCAELVSAGINTGTTTILSKPYLDALRQKLADQSGSDRYSDLYETVRDRINSKDFLAQNENPHLRYANIGMVDTDIDLQPLNQRCPNADQSGTGLAFMYDDFADIAYSSIRDTYPRRDLAGLTGDALPAAHAFNAQVAQIQIQAFRQMADKFKGLASLPADTATAFDVFVERVVAALDQVYPSAADRDRAFADLMSVGRQFTPTGPNGEGMFIPPDLYLRPTQGWAGVANIGIACYPENLEQRSQAEGDSVA